MSERSRPPLAFQLILDWARKRGIVEPKKEESGRGKDGSC